MYVTPWVLRQSNRPSCAPLAQQAAQNSKQQFGMGDFNTVLMDNVIDGLDKYKSMAEQVMASDRVKDEFAKIVLDAVYDGFKQRGGGIGP
jgi:hypothetical protein